MSERPTVIVLPTDEARVAQLRQKLAEYDDRVLRNAMNSLHQKFGAICKSALLSRVLTDGRVVVAEVEQGLRERYGNYFESLRFENACAVVSDYCLTGGKNVLKRSPQ